MSNKIYSFGLFLNDLYFFYFELYFLLGLFFLLVFFAIVTNSKQKFGYYSAVQSVLNISFFFCFVLLLLSLLSCEIPYYIFNGFYYSDYSIIIVKNILVFLFLIFLFSLKSYIGDFLNYDYEFIVILFFSFFSSVLILNSNDLISLFFIIELQSLAFYILVSSKQNSSFSTESGLKYFIIGSFSSSLILFGISLIYGFTGLLSYNDLFLYSSGLFINFNFNYITIPFFLGLIFLCFGLLFKLGSAPFHMWMPDVYEGSPLIITAYLSTIPKISLIFVFVRLYYFTFFNLFEIYQIIFIFSAIFSIVLGSIAAIYQIKIKRLLTYSMITNTGYLVLAISLGNFYGIYILFFYLITYILIMLGLFFSFISLRDQVSGFTIKKINLLVNLWESNPYLCFSIFIFLFSIAGIPPLMGFYGKMFLFMFVVKLQMYWISILFVIFSAISVFYYIRLVKIMYFNRSDKKVFFKNITFLNSVIISNLTLLNIFFFINPNLLFKFVYNISLSFYL